MTPLKITFILMVTINVLACILPAYFHIHFHLEKKIHFNVLLYIELFVLFWTLWYIVGHIWREYELSLYLSFAYCYSSKIESFTLCTSYWYQIMQQPPKSMFSCYHLHTRDEHGLSLGMLMHVKCIHELCSLLPHILLYLHIIWCYFHEFRWFWGFP